MPPPGPYAQIDDDDLPPPGAGHHPHGPSEMESVVAAPPPASAPVRYAMNHYPACSDDSSDRCIQRRVVVVHRERLLRIGERG